MFYTLFPKKRETHQGNERKNKERLRKRTKKIAFSVRMCYTFFMNDCTLCPVQCRVDRTKTAGRCRVNGLKIAKYGLHPYEEPPLSGERGAGTVFFCGCSLQCVFCQNFELSRNKRGKEITVQELAEIFRALEEKGAATVDLVSPTQYADKIAEALSLYRPRIPVVYNTHGYERIETLQMLSPFVDVWLPDLKFFSPKLSERYTGRADYFEFASKAIEWMAQTPLSFDEEGTMQSGTLVRHLILPLSSSDSIALLKWLAPMKENVCLSLMSQYTPFGDIEAFPELQRTITDREYRRVLDAALAIGFPRLFVQDKESASKDYIPDWDY